MKKVLTIVLVLLALVAAVGVYWFVFRKDLNTRVVVPYIAHQKPRVDPHVPSAVPIADKLDEALFDGLFNVSASPSGVVYEDGLGEFMGIDKKNVVTVRLKPSRKWHSSWGPAMEEDKLEKLVLAPKEEFLFTARDLAFSLKRIERLASLSPDHILVGQAVPDFTFSGPNENGDIQFEFKGDRTWNEGDIKEILSFKVLPYNAEMAAANYLNGTGPFLAVSEFEDEIYYHKIPDGQAVTPWLVLKPFIDNSTYATELKNGNINALLSTPFGAVSPILGDTTKFFYKSSIATTFFALFYNCQKLNLEQRKALRGLVNSKAIANRFFKIGTPQQRHIADYRSAGDNYDEYMNFSVFPATSYYVDEQLILPPADLGSPDVSVLPDTVRIQTCVEFEYKEELTELVEILNDPTMFNGKIKATTVKNEEIAKGMYDAVLVPISGYRSNFLFDLYNVFLREPDFASNRISLKTTVDAKGKGAIDPSSLEAARNFFRLDLAEASPEQADIQQLLAYVYAFMSTSEVGDKQQYARMIDEIEQRLYLGGWLFSLPSLAYFRTQFDPASIDMYGTASQLSTIEKWKEVVKTGWRKYF